MLRVALTGGIATGKSHALARFAVLSAPTIDADVIARDAVRPGEQAWAAVRDRFGQEIFTADDTIDRERLGAVVFVDARARADLEGIVHPVVRAAIDRFFATLARGGTAKFGIADIPLLFETGRQSEFDRVIVTACEPRTQLQRLMARGMSEADAQARLAAQLPTAEKTGRADFVITTDGTREETDRQVDAIYAALTETA